MKSATELGAAVSDRARPCTMCGKFTTLVCRQCLELGVAVHLCPNCKAITIGERSHLHEKGGQE